MMDSLMTQTDGLYAEGNLGGAYDPGFIPKHAKSCLLAFEGCSIGLFCIF
jgi:hypothetical protein